MDLVYCQENKSRSVKMKSFYSIQDLHKYLEKSAPVTLCVSKAPKRFEIRVLYGLVCTVRPFHLFFA